MFSVLYSNRTWKAHDQTLCHMPTVWPDSSVVKVHAHSERDLSSSPCPVMGAGGQMSNVKKKHMT